MIACEVSVGLGVGCGVGVVVGGTDVGVGGT